MKTMFTLLTLALIVGSAFGQSAELHEAAYSGDVSKVREILKKGVDPDDRDSFGGTALHAAMFQKNMEIVRLLIEYKFDVNAVGPKNGYTPLHDAVWADNLEGIKLLLAKGAKTTIKGEDGLTPYAKAKKEGKADIVTYFESRGIKE